MQDHDDLQPMDTVSIDAPVPASSPLDSPAAMFAEDTQPASPLREAFRQWMGWYVCDGLFFGRVPSSSFFSFVYVCIYVRACVYVCVCVLLLPALLAGLV
jgi:hypothetical protein